MGSFTALKTSKRALDLGIALIAEGSGPSTGQLSEHQRHRQHPLCDDQVDHRGGPGRFDKGATSLTVQGVGRVKIHLLGQNHAHLAATFE